jgi:hypothetical protein
LQAPNPPSNLTPNATAFDATNSKMFTWQHNPLDGSTQTAYSIQYKVNGGSYPGTPQVNGTASSISAHTFAGTTFTNNTTYKYQVKTKGAYSSYSAWSTEMTFYASTTPVGTITSPTAISNYASSTLTVNWSYTDADSNAQVQYMAKLYDENDTLLETKNAASAATSVVFDTKLANLTSYYLTLEVQDSTGLWSAINGVNFTTTFAVPPTPTIILIPDELTGTVQIAITNPSPAGAEIAAVSNDVYRSTNGCLTYSKFLTGVTLNTTVTDYIPIIGTPVYYYVEAVSSTPTVAASTVSYTTLTCTGFYCLNTGGDYSTSYILFRESTASELFGYEVNCHQFEGRTYKTKFQSTHKVNDIALSAEILAADLTTVRNLVETTTKVHYRDYTGRWFNCAIINPSFAKKSQGQTYNFSCNITRLEEEAFV